MRHELCAPGYAHRSRLRHCQLASARVVNVPRMRTHQSRRRVLHVRFHVAPHNFRVPSALQPVLQLEIVHDAHVAHLNEQ